MNRRKFISLSGIASIAALHPQILLASEFLQVSDKDQIISVTGSISARQLGPTLAHEHLITDFSGAEKNLTPFYKNLEAIERLLPHLLALKKSGINSMVECTPAYIGRNALLLKELSLASGLQIITNTGYYAAVGQKYLPAHAVSESAEQIANRWLSEWTNGIDGTQIRPGFIKLGVDTGPLKEIEKKLIRAAAITHLKSGLKIFIHTGDALAAKEEAALLIQEGLSPEAMVWVHAQNDAKGDTQIELAKKGCWISLDGINEQPAALERYAGFILRMKREGLLDKLLISHDDGFSVEKSSEGSIFQPYQNGNQTPYRSLFTKLKPILLEKGMTGQEFSKIISTNPAQALKINICKATKS